MCARKNRVTNTSTRQAILFVNTRDSYKRIKKLHEAKWEFQGNTTKFEDIRSFANKRRSEE